MTLESWQLRSRKYGYGQVDRLNREMEMSSVRRGENAHEPTEMKEGLAWEKVREWFCPVCPHWEMRWKEDLPTNFIGLTCAGDAVLESVEG